MNTVTYMINDETFAQEYRDAHGEVVGFTVGDLSCLYPSILMQQPADIVLPQAELPTN